MSLPEDRAAVRVNSVPIKIKSKFRTIFRSGSVDGDKDPFTLDVDESRSRSFSFNEAVTRKDGSPKPHRKPEMEALKMALSRTAAMQAQHLHNAVLSSTTPTTTPPLDKKSYKKQPTGTFEYTVQEGDTLVKIGARFDVTPSELIKINKLLSRTVFVGQTMFIPDSSYASSSSSTPRSSTPVPNPTQADSPLIHVPSVPDHTAQVTSSAEPVKVIIEQVTDFQEHQENRVVEEPGRDIQQKFLKMPVRRVLDEDEKTAVSMSSTVRGTLLVTPNAIMFDPDVCDPLVISSDDQERFSVVVYMEEVKSVALFHDFSPRMFWRLPKELRASSPKPETYRSDQGKRPKVQDHSEEHGGHENIDHNKLTTDPSDFEGDQRQPGGIDALDGSMGKIITGSTSEELKQMEELSGHGPDSVQHQSKLSEEVEHTGSSHKGHTPASMTIKHNQSHSSDLDECEVNHQDAEVVFGETRDFGSLMGRSSEVQSQSSGAIASIPDSSPAAMSGHPSTPAQSFEPVNFTDRSPKTVTAHPKPVSGQGALVLSQSPTTATDVTEDTKAADLDNPEQLKCTHNKTDDPSMRNALDSSDYFNNQKNLSSEDKTKPSGNSNESQRSVTSLEADTDVSSNLNEDNESSIRKNISEHNASWSEKAQTVVGKLAFQVSNLTWDSVDQKDGSSKLRGSSPQSSFSPLRTPAHHLSSLFNYTSSFFRGAPTTDKDSSSAIDTSTSDGRSKYSPSYGLQLKSEFTKEDISKALGRDPREFMLRSDSQYFQDPPLYLQIRRGIRKNIEIFQPRAFDHRNTGPMLSEYWFVVPRDMRDKLYNFLMTWQPDAYGNEEETESRGQFFYDVDTLAQPGIKVGDASHDGFHILEDHFKEAEKTWEILSKEEVYGAEKEQGLYRQDTIDECSFPELIGPTVIIEQEHIRPILLSLPLSMSVGYNWKLVYATHKHGYSLQNLYMRTENVGEDSPVLLFIKDTDSNVFGAYLSDTIRQNDTFYGSGATFLFTFYPEFKKFPWRGENEFFMNGTKEFFAVGSGEGLFGLWVDGDLDKGRSRQCPTFFNDVLSREEDFSILQLEVWTFVDSNLS